MIRPKDDLLSTAQLTIRLGTSSRHVVRWAEDGIIPFVWSTTAKGRERQYSLSEVLTALTEAPALWGGDPVIAPNVGTPSS